MRPPSCWQFGRNAVTKYLLNRLLRGLLSVVVVVALVMILVYSLVDREAIFRQDPVYTKKLNNEREVYRYVTWEEFGYLDYVSYSDYLIGLEEEGKLTTEERTKAALIGQTADKDPDNVAKYVREFTEFYEIQGYTVK